MIQISFCLCGRFTPQSPVIHKKLFWFWENLKIVSYVDNIQRLYFKRSCNGYAKFGLALKFKIRNDQKKIYFLNHKFLIVKILNKIIVLILIELHFINVKQPESSNILKSHNNKFNYKIQKYDIENSNLSGTGKYIDPFWTTKNIERW